jgi:hypothetical protein
MFRVPPGEIRDVAEVMSGYGAMREGAVVVGSGRLTSERADVYAVEEDVGGMRTELVDE